MEKQGQNFLLSASFLWLSLTLHLYALYFAAMSPSFKEFLERAASPPHKELKVQNIIIETAEEQARPEDTAFISDKNTLNSAPNPDTSRPEAYNYAASLQPSALGREEAQQEQAAVQESGRIAKPASAGGQSAPFYFDPEKDPIVNMYTGGNLSIAAEAKDYAKYFLAMQEKIGRYHKEFFPIYQYYQGLLRDGVVVVDFTVGRNGDVLKAEVVSSYGSDTVDKASLNSILYAKNFGPLPPELASQSPIKIRFHFVYFAR